MKAASMIRNPIVWSTALLQLVGPYLFGFSNWCNVIQYLGGFGVPLAVAHFYRQHRREIEQLRGHILHLHEKHDALMGKERKESNVG